MRRRRSAFRRRGPAIGTVVLLGVLLGQLPSSARAGEGFLNRNLKSTEAVPYGRDLEAPRPSPTPPAGGATDRAMPVPAPTPRETAPAGE